MPQTFTKTELLKQLNQGDSELVSNLQQCYSNTRVLNSKIKLLTKLLNDPKLEPELQTIITRCPGRISLSKHLDYVNGNLLYLLDDREIFVASQIKDSCNELQLCNEEFFSVCIKLDQLETSSLKSNDWHFYILTLIKKLQEITSVPLKKGLTLAFASDLPAGGGLSSSHALILSTLLNICHSLKIHEYQTSLANPFNNKATVRKIIQLCQDIEKARGFNSGLGDQCAQIFGQKNKFTSIKIFPNLDIKYIDKPQNLSLLTAPSLIKADKSLPEFAAANQNIKSYKAINSLAQELGYEFLCDIAEHHGQTEIFEFLSKITNRQSQGLALYALAESTRVKNLSMDFSAKKLGEHLNLSHQAEQNFKLQNLQWLELSSEEKQSFELNPAKDLAKHSGIYRASTQANDKLQLLANELDSVYGSGISGAGLGGNNIIACNNGSEDLVIEHLNNNFYQNDKKLIHINASSSALCRLA